MEKTGEGAVRDQEEVEKVVWLKPRKAIDQLDYPEERRLLAMEKPDPDRNLFSGGNGRHLQKRDGILAQNRLIQLFC